MEREFKIGLVGCGRISQAYTQVIQDMPGVALKAVMDVRPEAAQSAAEASGCGAFSDLETFIRDAGIEGAIVCAPPAEHRPIACALMEQGIHTLCEKPFATNLDDAMAMVATADQKDLVLMMASKFRYVEDIIRAKSLITSGMLGDVQFYENRFCAKVNMQGRWNADPAIAGGGVLIDNGTHSVDIVRYLVGPITRVQAREGKRLAGLPVEDTVCLSFLTEGGVMGTIYLSWSLQIESGGYINMHGADGAMSIGWQESKYQHNGHPQWVSFGVGYDKFAAFRNQVQNFAETVRGSAQPIITSEEGLASVQVIEAAYRSMQTQQWEEVGPVPPISNIAVVS